MRWVCFVLWVQDALSRSSARVMAVFGGLKLLLAGLPSRHPLRTHLPIMFALLGKRANVVLRELYGYH